VVIEKARQQDGEKKIKASSSPAGCEKQPKNVRVCVFVLQSKRWLTDGGGGKARLRP
jgi:hypothetical protein